MTDIFREVEEEVRRERYVQIWKKYGDYIITGAALLIVAVAGFQLWRVYEQRQQAKASLAYVEADQLLQAGQAGAAAQAFARLAQQAPSGYAATSRLQEADALYAAGNIPEALDIYKEVIAKGGPLLAPVARIRAAWATVDTASRADLNSLVSPLLDAGNPWHPMAQEIVAYADYRVGASAKALKEFDAIAKDHDTPDAVRQRAIAMVSFIQSGGDKNFGAMPPIAPTANAATPPSQSQTPAVPAPGSHAQ